MYPSPLTRPTGTYTLSVIVLGANGASEADTDFPNNNTPPPARLRSGPRSRETSNPRTDKDWFEVDLEAGKRYQFDLEGAPNGRGTQPDPYLVLYDGSLQTILGTTTTSPPGTSTAR